MSILLFHYFQIILFEVFHKMIGKPEKSQICQVRAVNCSFTTLRAEFEKLAKTSGGRSETLRPVKFISWK